MIPAIIAITAFVIDTIIGDPQNKFHPVAVMGRIVSIIERIFRHDKHSEPTKLVLGLIFTIVCLSLSYYFTRGIVWLLEIYVPIWWLKIFIEALILSFMISPKSLMQAGIGVIDSLLHNNLDEARQKVHFIVGRDVDKMNESEAARATIETIAENTTDGIISPLFFFFIGGLPLAVLYRMANTLDSMVGYKNDKYLYFGRASARVDDVLNLIPARISGLLFVIAAAILHFDYRLAWKMILRDARKHPSPNGGYTEAAVAGALNIRLGGHNFYFGQPHFRAYMGDDYQEICARHIKESIQLMYTVTILFIMLITVLLPVIPLWWHNGF